MRYIKYAKRKRQFKIVALALVAVLACMPLTHTYATNLNDAQNKRDEAQNALEEANSSISDIEAEQETLQEEIDALDAELVAVIMNLSVLENDLARKEDELIAVQKDLEKAQSDEAEQYGAMKKRIQFMYERGDTAFLTALLESQNVADLLNRVEYVNEVYAYDRDLLTTYQKVKQQVAELELQVQSEIAELEEMQVVFQDEQVRYETMIDEKQAQMENFDTQLAKARELAAEYQATIEQQNEIIRQEEERIRQEEERRKQEQESGGSNPSDSGGGSNPGYATSVSGQEVVDFACQFIGNRYVWGGNDLYNGVDCSGFVQQVYLHFGISLPRHSSQQGRAGVGVSYSNAQPGDIIYYAGHVAIYMGNGKIVHASNSAPYPAGGIKISNATYQTILAVRRVL